MGQFLSPLPIDVEIIPTRNLVFRLNAPLIYQSKRYGKFTVKKGFITDLASIPRFLPLSLQTGDLAPAAIIHDYLYAFQPVPRKTADLIFFEAALDSKVATGKADLFYFFVRMFGWAAWNKNKKAKINNNL